jgi:signal transduction histidine kinase
MTAAPRRTLRARMMTWYTAVLVAALGVYAAVVYVSLRRVLWAELDDRLHHEIETIEGLLQPYWTADGVRTPDGASPLDDDDYRWCQVWSRDGTRLLFESEIAKGDPLPRLAPPRVDAATSLVRETGDHLRVKDELGHIAKHPIIVRVATSEARVRGELIEMVALMGGTLLLCAVAAAYGGYHLVRRTLAPVDRLVRAANAVTAEDLSRRLPVENAADEVGQIAFAFNATLARLEASFTQMRRFTANASHELRTPLTALRSTGQVALTGAGDATDHREAIASMLEEVERLSKLLDTLLLLARSDAGQIKLTTQSVNVLTLVQEVAADCRVLADEKAQTISIVGTDGAVSADPTVLRIAVANIVHNAIRYSPARGCVRIRVLPQANGIAIEI